MASCPKNSILYNGSHCACQVGHFLNLTANSCTTYGGSSSIQTDSGIDYYAVSFPETIFSFDSIKKFTQSQAVFLEATLVMLVSWLVFCFFLRFTKLGDGRNVWFKIRWWISRLDVCFATRHWLVSPFCLLWVMFLTVKLLDRKVVKIVYFIKSKRRLCNFLPTHAKRKTLCT